MPAPSQNDQKQLVKLIKSHLRATKQKPYTWSKRVMGDKTFLWKLENWGRMPFRSTLKKIETSIRADRRRLKLAGDQVKIVKTFGVRRGG